MILCVTGSRLCDGGCGNVNGKFRPIRCPVLISFMASKRQSFVSRFRAPNSSSGPYSPHAENGGSFLPRGSDEKGGRRCCIGAGIVPALQLRRKYQYDVNDRGFPNLYLKYSKLRYMMAARHFAGERSHSREAEAEID